MPGTNTSFYPAPYMTGGNLPQTSPSMPTGEVQPSSTTSEPTWTGGGSSAGTSGIGDDYVSAGGAGYAGGGAGATGSSSSSWYDQLSQAVADSGIGAPMGGTLFDSW